MVVDLLVEPGQIAHLLVGGADLPDVSNASWMPSETRIAACFVRSEARAEIFRVPNSRPKATGTPHRQAMVSRQSYTSRHTAIMAVEM